MNCDYRVLLLFSFALFIAGCSPSLSERLEQVDRGKVAGQIVSLELPSAPDGSRFVFLESELQAFCAHFDELTLFDLNLDETNQNDVSYYPPSTVRLRFADGMTSDVFFSSTYTEATGALFVLGIADGGFQGIDEFITPIRSFLTPARQKDFVAFLRELSKFNPRNKHLEWLKPKTGDGRILIDTRS